MKIESNIVIESIIIQQQNNINTTQESYKGIPTEYEIIPNEYKI